MTCDIAMAIRHATITGRDDGGALTAMLDRAEAVLYRADDTRDHQFAGDYFGLAYHSAEEQAKIKAALREAIAMHRPTKVVAA